MLEIRIRLDDKLVHRDNYLSRRSRPPSAAMFENRLHRYFSRTSRLATTLTPGDTPKATNSFPCQPIGAADIYQAAFERARQDYELNRLFNPEFYKDGSGI